MIALYPGAFKPPHRGHFNVVKSLLDGSYNGTIYNKDDYKEKGSSLFKNEKGDKPKIEKVVVFIGGNERNGIDQKESKSIWDIYNKHLGNVEIVAGAKNPMFEARDYARANENEEFVAVTGVRDETDFVDLRRVTTFTNTDNVQGLAITSAADTGVRASDFRKNILSGNLDQIADFFPEDLNREEILSILNNLKDKIVAEVLSNNIEGFIENYFVSETADPQDGKAAPYGSGYKKVGLKEYIASLLEYMLDQKMKITPLPEVKLRKDPAEAANFFGRTAYYDPNMKEIVLYTEGRHMKDIVRSFAHEMIHHKQNLEGKLENVQTTNTNESDNLLELEKEAYLEGNITFRNWEDSLK